MKNEKVQMIEGSGNVFEDVGMPDPVDWLARAELAMLIGDILHKRRLTQVQAARVLGTTQPKVCDLLAGRLGGFSIQRLMKYLLALDHDVQIVVQPRDMSNLSSRITVVSAG